jgi:ATP-dependent helicase/nuclease subunit A
MSLDDATLNQIRAADPASSTWLTANAGSGKTKVLTDRVARLLLAGTDPQHILCLTYTKAAASEMQNRLFGTLGRWALMEDGALRAELARLGEEAPGGPERLAEARRLFARAIETPGGLRIQTIHSFCAALLRRFPLEAGVSPNFLELDDRSAAFLREEVASALAEEDAEGRFGAIAPLIAGEDMAAFTEEIITHRAGFAREVSEAEIRRWLGLPQALSMERLLADTFSDAAEFMPRVIAALRAGSTNDQKAAADLAPLDFASATEETLIACESVFLTKSGAAPFTARIGKFPTKATREVLGDDTRRLEALMRRVEAARPMRVGLKTAEATLALHRFARAFLEGYEARKQSLARLDFDDLIGRTLALLEDPAVSAWVLYRLDGGIDHILVDEAQDTSPEQWRVIARLAEEFTAGEGGRAGAPPRTLFVVGDPKQSIYSFQGADAREFARMQEHFARRFGAAGQPLLPHELAYSFRSSPAILRAVDLTFPDWTNGPPRHEPVAHRPFYGDLPGRVDLWPLEPAPEKAEDPPWHEPVDVLAPGDNRLELARKIARHIRELIGTPLPDGTGAARPIGAGDIMVLVQRRGVLFHEIIRACKAEGLPVAGADRLKLGEELAVRDLTALLSFLATPEDELSLAAALRSPLFGWSEADLFRIAANRGGRPLRAVLEARRDEWPETHAMLRDLRDAADFLRPYDLIERILIRHDGRRRLIARLGEEAEEGIDALLEQALAYEQAEVPSLTGFVSWLQAEDVELKRQMGAAEGRLRVMTVHGAKGLEAPVVILPDTVRTPPVHRGRLIAAEAEGEGPPRVFWKAEGGELPPAVEAALGAWRAEQEEERRRLLYVAMTRAEQWLIVCGAEAERSEAAWHEAVKAGLERAGAVAAPFPTGEGLRYEVGDWSACDVTPATGGQARAAPALPRWAREHAPPAVEAPAVLRPSDLPGEKALPGEAVLAEGDDPLRRGRQLHLLLEHLPHHPPARRPEIAASLLMSGEDAVTDSAELALLLEDAARVLDEPALAPLFAPGALAEVAVTAPLPELGGRRVHGTIDRLIVEPGRVLAIDFKTNRIVPGTPQEVPAGLLAQMGAYRAALGQIYPDRTIETAILWTAVPRLMPLPDDLVTAAFARAAAP